MEKSSSELIYQEPLSLSDSEFEAMIRSGSEREICDALIGLGFDGENFEFAKGLLFEFVLSEQSEVARCALVGVAHLARRFGKISAEEFAVLVEKMPLKDELKFGIGDVFDDISVFYKKRKKRKTVS